MLNLILHNLELHGVVPYLTGLIAAQLVNKFPMFYWTQSFITKLTTAHHLSLSWTRLVQSTLSHLIRTHFNIILPEPSSFMWSISFRFPPKPCQHFCCPWYMQHAPPILAYLIFISLIIVCDIQIMKLFIMQLPSVPCYFLPLRPKYLQQPTVISWSYYCVTLSSCYLLSLGSKYSPQHPNFRHPQVMFFA